MVEAVVLRGSSVLPVGTAGRPTADASPAGPRGVTAVGSGDSWTGAPEAAVPPLTLTRRGRFVLIGLPIVLGVSLLIFLGALLTSRAEAGEGPVQASPTVAVTVLPGETLWAIALHHAPDRDTRDVVAEIVELNGLTTSAVQVGQSISVPVAG